MLPAHELGPVSKKTIEWEGPRADKARMSAFGLRLAGGGPHQSKTMMFTELEALLAIGGTDAPGLSAAAIEGNALGKSTRSTGALTFRQMAALYGLVSQPPLTRALFALWHSDPVGRRLQAMLVALARDPLLRDTAAVIVDGPPGSALRRPSFEAALTASHPARFSEKMLRSLAQNCASTWTQSGHLDGAIKKVRRRVSPTPATVTLAALLATASGFGGPSILSSAWVRVLDLSPENALDQLRRAEALGLARVRSAGDVIEISIRQPMALTLKVRELEYV